jgi:hypothetical protein
VPQPDGTVARRINEGQAAIVRRIFELYADGLGFKKIAETLNQDGLLGPRGTPWRHTAIRELLHNPTFGGSTVWNKTKRVAHGGKTNVKVRRAESEHVTVAQPELQIVSDEMMAKVRGKHAENGAAFARGAGGRSSCGTRSRGCGRCSKPRWPRPGRPSGGSGSR